MSNTTPGQSTPCLLQDAAWWNSVGAGLVLGALFPRVFGLIFDTLMDV